MKFYVLWAILCLAVVVSYAQLDDWDDLDEPVTSPVIDSPFERQLEAQEQQTPVTESPEWVFHLRDSQNSEH